VTYYCRSLNLLTIDNDGVFWIYLFMLDVGAIALFVIWIANYPDWEKLRCASRRGRFLVKLGTDLVEDEINRRLQRPRALRKHSKAALRTLEYLNPQKEAHRGQPAEKKRCYLCPRDQDRKTRTSCTNCGNRVCQEHLTMSTVCDECL